MTMVSQIEGSIAPTTGTSVDLLVEVFLYDLLAPIQVLELPRIPQT